MEFGPRALGARSILGDPRSPTMQKTLNLKVKYRESFRPFAPRTARRPCRLVCARHQLALHAVGRAQKRRVSGRSPTPNTPYSASTSLIYNDPYSGCHPCRLSARVQTVHANTNALFHALISRFKALTGCPVLVNTSFNVRGEPIVCTPEDAFRCFMGTEIEMLAVGNCVLRNNEQHPQLKQDYSDAFALH